MLISKFIQFSSKIPVHTLLRRPHLQRQCPVRAWVGPVLCAWIASAAAARGEVFSNVPAAAGYEVVYELDIPLNGAFQGTTSVPYSVDESATVAPEGFDRIAYYLELTGASGSQWVFASLDAFTSAAVQTGLPHAVNNPVTFQQSVTNLEVISNVNTLKSGVFDRGQIEMWHHTYTAPNANGVFAASATTNDWGDTIGTTASGYGSFQIHNPEGRQVVLAYNRWATGGAANDDVGIGNSGGTHPDWTLAGNTPSYTGRKLVVLVRPKQFEVTFTELPRIQQITPRDVATNLATVPVSGTESLGGFDAAVLKIYRNGLPCGDEIEQELNYAGGGASFSFQPQIPAELASYTFELHLRKNENLFLVRSVRDVVAGDVYLWYGQSNAESRPFSGSADAYLSPWIRTFGMASDFANFTQNSAFWVEADGDGCLEVPAGIGQWPLVVGRRIVDTYGIPVAILNGSRAAYSMPELQRDDADPDNLTNSGGVTRPYNRLRFRAIQAKLADQVRGIFFYQGESDENNAGQHITGFDSLVADWQTDYPSVERIFVSQVHVGCTNSAPVTRELPELRDAQRLFADVYDNVHIMSTNGLATHVDNCHFPFTGGYETHGLNVSRQVQRELYGAPDEPAIDPPNPASVEIIPGNRIRIHLRKSGAGIMVETGALADFRLNGSSAALLSAAVTTTAIELQYDSPLTGATGLDYLAHIGGAGGWVRNSNGVGLLAFSEPILNKLPQVMPLSPAAVQVITPGTLLPLEASASTPVGSITGLQILINGILHTATGQSSTIEDSWLVPDSGTYQITFRATNSEGNTAESSIVVFTEPFSSPGGVTAGLTLWLKPESGIIRDENGLVSAWQDSGGLGNHCTQNTAASRPAFLPHQFGTLPGVVFDGGDWLTGSAGMSTGSYTKIVRVRMPDFASPSGNILSSAGGTGAGVVRHALFMSGTPNPRLWHNGPFATSNTAMIADQGHIIVATFDSATKTGTLYLDGQQVGTGTIAANTTDPSYQLGNLSGGNFTMRGAIGEALIYNRVISPEERLSVETYLLAKSTPPAETPRLNYTQWSDSVIPDGQDAGTTADYLSNGIPNGVEYALGLDPSSPPFPHPLSFSAIGGSAVTSYSRPTDRTGVIYRITESSDLLHWVEVEDWTQSISGFLETRRFTRPFVSDTPLFYRLEIDFIENTPP